jgi:hypothetical protein
VHDLHVQNARLKIVIAHVAEESWECRPTLPDAFPTFGIWETSNMTGLLRALFDKLEPSSCPAIACNLGFPC